MEYYRVYASVDLDAIEENYREIKKHIGDKVAFMPVIKADGYGHGALPIARELQRLDTEYIAVAVYQEGIALRHAGITKPILVLGNTPYEALEHLVENDLTQTVYSLRMGKELSEVATRMGKVVPIHIKVDTGMNRIGIVADEKAYETVVKIKALKNLFIEGVFTHFAKADETDKSYTNRQIKLFNEFLYKLEEHQIMPKYIHASNSAGMLEFKDAHYNLVRTGIALYGLYPSEEVSVERVRLRPALSIKSRVIFVKEVQEDELVSYGGTYRTTRKTKIATIPVGYADGYSRALSSKGRVIIHGKYAPVIGRVCMDQFMIDVTDIEDVKENDEVVLIGKSNGLEITVEEIARHMNTINYEVICLIGKRVPRVYVKKGEVIDQIDYFD